MTPLSAIDLNLLVALEALVTESSVSAAAVRVGLSQPAMSHALRRLREVFDDDILVRQGRAMVPTPRALQLHAGVAEGMEAIRMAVEGPKEFDPGAMERSFSLGMTDWTARQHLPDITRRLRREAPGVTLRVVNCGSVDGCERVFRGELDLGLGVYMADVEDKVASLRLKTASGFQCVVDADNPRLKDGVIDLEAYLSLPHVVVAVNEDPGINVDQALEGLGLFRKVALIVPYFMSVPYAVQGTDLLGHVTQELVDATTVAACLRVVPPPIQMPKTVRRVIWRRGAGRDAGLRWLRNLVADAAGGEADS